MRTGGRQAGTPNKRTAELTARLAELGLDPLEGLAKIAQDPATEPGLRAKIYSDLMPFVYPKRKAVELAAEGVSELRISWAGSK